MINIPATLFRYIGKSFLLHFIVLVTILLGILYVFEMVELIRRASTLPKAVGFDTLLTLGAMKLPGTGQRMLPFGVLFAAIYTCWKLNKTHELVVIRASGLSAWQFLSPMVAAALLIGIVEMTLINPMASILLSRYEQMEVESFQKDANLLTISRAGIWLRQPTEKGYALIRSEGFDQKEWRLTNVILFFFDKQNSFTERMDAAEAKLGKGQWEIKKAVINQRNSALERDDIRLPTELTARKIEESFAAPETISFWKIPDFIRIMEETGFPATRLQIYFQSMIAKPLLYAAMILLAATFSLRPPRFGGTGIMIALGVLAGFFIFFMESMLQAFGISQKIPVYLAAWTPALVSLLFGMTALLHLEDG